MYNIYEKRNQTVAYRVDYRPGCLFLHSAPPFCRYLYQRRGPLRRDDRAVHSLYLEKRRRGRVGNSPVGIMGLKTVMEEMAECLVRLSVSFKNARSSLNSFFMSSCALLAARKGFDKRQLIAEKKCRAFD